MNAKSEGLILDPVLRVPSISKNLGVLPVPPLLLILLTNALKKAKLPTKFTGYVRNVER